MDSFMSFSSSCTALFSLRFPCFTVDLTVFAERRQAWWRLLSSPQGMRQLSLLHAVLAPFVPTTPEIFLVLPPHHPLQNYHRHSGTRITKVFWQLAHYLVITFYPIFCIRNPKTKFSNLTSPFLSCLSHSHLSWKHSPGIPSFPGLSPPPPSCPFLCPPVSIFSL